MPTWAEGNRIAMERDIRRLQRARAGDTIKYQLSRIVMRNFLAFLLLTYPFISLRAEINLIPFQFGSENKSDIPTIAWAKPASIATLIFIPGGSGSFGLTKRSDPQPTWVLSELYKSLDGPINLVFMDSDYPLQADFGDPYTRWAARREVRHIERIKVTINYYQKLFGKPVFLFGHSNGSLSIAEFLNQSPENQSLISGLIFSGSRNETEVRQKITIPVMVLHHKADQNRWTTPSSAERLFTTLNRNNSVATEQGWVEGGRDIPGGDPTHTGRHMYNEALAEAANLIETFIKKWALR